jgi:diaminobutyrate-2-oxoglutarate transaminase
MKPGDHGGTFRGVNSSFVTGAQALRSYWSDGTLEKSTRDRGARVIAALTELAGSGPDLEVRGRGLAAGLRLRPPGLAQQVSVAAFERGLLVETSGARGDVVKLLPPLTIGDDDLDEGLDIIRTCVSDVLARAR